MNMISIIVPCYNAAKYLDECLMSISKQSYQNWETICVNDGSRDNTLEIIEKFANKDQRFTVISQENQGVAVARNNALKICKGEYICFVDSDDVIEPDFLETLVNMMDDNKDLSICNFTREMTDLYEKAKKATIKWTKTGNECAEKIILDKSFSPQICCMMFKKNIIDKYNIYFYPNCTRGEDWEFYMKYLVHTKFVSFSDYIVYHYRQNITSAMSQFNMKSLTSIEAAERVTNYYISLNNQVCNIVKQYAVSRVVWKHTILSLIKHDINIYKAIHNKYNVKEEMYNMFSYPGKIERLTSRLYNFSELIFRCCFYLIGFIYQHK